MSRVAAICRGAFADGPMGEHQRGEAYARFVSCGIDPDGGKQLATVRTSCAIFARAVLHYAGLVTARPWRPGQGIFRGWLHGLDDHCPSWVKYTGAETPESGDVFFIQSPSHPNNCHVGIFIEPQGDGWCTAEGGGGDGTGCSMGGRPRVVGPRFDRWGRVLRGWWSARILADAAERATTIPPPPHEQATLPLPEDTRPRTLRVGNSGPDVAAVQRVVGAVPDGNWGPNTDAKVKAWQLAHGLTPDGVVGPATRAAMGL